MTPPGGISTTTFVRMACLHSQPSCPREILNLQMSMFRTNVARKAKLTSPSIPPLLTFSPVVRTRSSACRCADTFPPTEEPVGEVSIFLYHQRREPTATTLGLTRRSP